MDHVDHTSCTGFTRSQALRQAAAQAGRGLPAIEPGMPLPAGTGLTRRTVMLRSLGAGLAVYGAGKLGTGAFEAGIAEAAAAPPAPVLLSVFLPGGIDGLSVLAPVGDPRYATLRTSLRQDGGVPFREDLRLAWHPSAEGLRTLYEEGKVAVAPAIGYSGADQSHFTSRHFWEVGATDPGGRFGWLGRYLDAHGSATNPLQGVSLAGTLSPVIAAGRVPVAALSKPDDMSLWAPGVDDPIAPKLLEAIGVLGAVPTSDPGLLAARAVATQVGALRSTLAPIQAKGATPGFTTAVAYPDGDFPRRLAGLAAMLAAGMPVRTATVDAPGSYDTHSNQAGSLPQNLKATCDGLLAFQRDLEARGLAGRVITLVWSEFGRRPKQNGDGTDHGAAGVGFVLGSRVRGVQLGEFPGLATLDARDNLRSTFDFRSVYCSLLEQWFGVDAGPIIPGAAGFARPQLIT